MLQDAGQWMSHALESGAVYPLLFPAYLLLIAADRLAHALSHRPPWNNRDAAANLFITGGYLVGELAVGSFQVALFALLHAALAIADLGSGLTGWVIAFLLYDLAWYVDHRLGHRVGLFWAMHQTHHSSNEYNMTVASRGSWLDLTLLNRPAFLLLPIVGFTPAHFMAIRALTNLWGIAQHTQMIDKAGLFEQFIATPSNHRVHHGCDPKYLDRNYGEVLIVWDRLFGTYQREEEPPTYGVTERLESCNPYVIETEGWRWLARKMARAKGWRAKFSCLYLPPGVEPG